MEIFWVTNFWNLKKAASIVNVDTIDSKKKKKNFKLAIRNGADLNIIYYKFKSIRSNKFYHKYIKNNLNRSKTFLAPFLIHLLLDTS